MNGDTFRWRRCASVFPCGLPFIKEIGADLMNTPRDINRAREAIRAAGYSGERVVVMNPGDFPSIGPLGEVTADLLKRLGMNVDLQTMDWGTLVQRRTSKAPPAQGGWNIFFTSGAGVSSSDPFTNPASTACDKAWFGWPCNAEIEKLRDAWTRETDPKKQREVLETLHRKLMEEGIWYTYGQWFTQTAFRSNLSGIQATPVRYFWNVKKG